MKGRRHGGPEHEHVKQALPVGENRTRIGAETEATVCGCLSVPGCGTESCRLGGL